MPVWLRVFAWAGVLVAFGASLAVGAGRLWQHLEQRPEFALDASTLRLGYTQDCIKEEAMAQELRSRLPALPDTVSLLRGDLAERIGQELSNCPWVLEVEAVERQFPNRLSVRVNFRNPAAIVQFEGQNYLVDRQGFWLPGELYRLPADWDAQSTPCIVDAGLRGSPCVGQRWGWPRIAAGAMLTEFLREKGLFDKLALRAVDVSHVGKGGTKPEIVLICNNGAHVRWGTSRCYAHIEGLEPLPDAASDEEKLSKLLAKLQEYPELDQLEYIDLRFHNKVSWGLRDTARSPDAPG